MKTPEQIVAGLGEAQKAEVLSLSGEWTVRRITWQPDTSVWLPPSIMEQSLPPRIDCERLRLTELGQSVRAILKEQDDVRS